MKISVRSLIFTILIGLGNGSLAPGQAPAPSPARAPFVIIKLDDLRKPSPAFQQVVDYLKEKNIKCAIGIICKSLEGNHPAYCDWIKQLAQSGQVEFWNHGWDHRNWQENGKDMYEFTAPYEQQKQHFERAQQLGKEKLGLTFVAFNPGYGRLNDDTFRVLRENPDIKVFLFGDPAKADATPNMMILDRPAANLEAPTFVPNPERFKHNFAKLADTRDVFVIQGHPDMWKTDGFENFKKIVEYLASQNVIFTTPREYYESHHPAPKTP